MPGDEMKVNAERFVLHPSAWLVVPTLALLTGQAAVALPWAPQRDGFAAFLILFSLLVSIGLLRRCWRGCAWLLLLSLGAFYLGYYRHRALLEPQFSRGHLRSIMVRDGTMLLEGKIVQEPERLVNRSRWLMQLDHLWHPTGDPGC